MDYRKITVASWNQLDGSGNSVSGYKSIWLASTDLEKSDIHIFKDEFKQYHLAVKVLRISKGEIHDPGVNGLQLGFFQYRFGTGTINNFIDLKCSIDAFLPEFTEVVKEVCTSILEKKLESSFAVQQVIQNWISFWASQHKQILTEEEQLGLICELIILKELCKINPANALNSWSGPLGAVHDFNFTAWNFEVKGTRKKNRIHSINGIDQLKPSDNKKLAFLSFLATSSDNASSYNLPNLIESVNNECFLTKPDLIVRFNELLAGIGYTPLHLAEYLKFNIEILKTTLYVVEDNFPKLTSDMINQPLDSRVSSIRYDISLAGILGTEFKEINWGDYFY